MITGWKLTIEACALTESTASRLAQEIAEKVMFAMDELSISRVDGSATATWEKIELPDVDPAENL